MVAVVTPLISFLAGARTPLLGFATWMLVPPGFVDQMFLKLSLNVAARATILAGMIAPISLALGIVLVAIDRMVINSRLALPES